MSFPVSVVIPTYNRAHCIERSINSVLNQTYKDFELIIVDDGSLDNTESLVSSIIEKDSRVRYERKENGGAADARNYGIEASKHEYIAFQDSDDVWLPKKLEKQVKYLEEHPDILFCYHRVRYPIGDGRAFIIPDDKTNPKDCNGDIFKRIMKDNLIGCPALIANKDLLIEVGGFDVSLKALEDYDLAIRLTKGRKAGYINEVLLDADFSVESVSQNPKNFLLASCMIVGKYLKDYLETDTLNHRITNIYESAKAAGLEELIIPFLENQIKLGRMS